MMMDLMTRVGRISMKATISILPIMINMVIMKVTTTQRNGAITKAMTEDEVEDVGGGGFHEVLGEDEGLEIVAGASETEVEASEVHGKVVTTVMMTQRNQWKFPSPNPLGSKEMKLGIPMMIRDPGQGRGRDQDDPVQNPEGLVQDLDLDHEGLDPVQGDRVQGRGQRGQDLDLGQNPKGLILVHVRDQSAHVRRQNRDPIDLIPRADQDPEILAQNQGPDPVDGLEVDQEDDPELALVLDLAPGVTVEVRNEGIPAAMNIPVLQKVGAGINTGMNVTKKGAVQERVPVIKLIMMIYMRVT